MTEYLKLIIIWIGLVATNLPTVCAQELQFDQVKKARKSLRMDKPNEVQAILSQLYKPKPSKKNDAPLVAEGIAFDDSYLEGKKPKQQDSTEYHFINGLLKLHQFEKENAKLYLNQKPDTIAYFTRLYEMMDSFEKCYPSIHALKKEDAEAKAVLQQHKDNLIRGGNFYLAKNELKTALCFFNKFVRLEEKKVTESSDSLLNLSYYNCAYIASELKDYEKVVSYCNILLSRGDDSEKVDLLICEALNKLERIDEWKETLQRAIKRHPNQFYFYAALIDYYLANNENNKALKYADELHKSDPMSGMKNFVKGYVYQRTGDYRNAIIWQEICDRLEPGVAENLSALGFNYVSLAEQVSSSLRGNYTTTEAKKELTGYYNKAKGYLEECRRIVPDKPQFWAPALYKVYYHLNDGDALDEIEEILHDEG